MAPPAIPAIEALWAAVEVIVWRDIEAFWHQLDFLNTPLGLHTVPFLLLCFLGFACFQVCLARRQDEETLIEWHIDRASKYSARGRGKTGPVPPPNTARRQGDIEDQIFEPLIKGVHGVGKNAIRRVRALPSSPEIIVPRDPPLPPSAWAKKDKEERATVGRRVTIAAEFAPASEPPVSAAAPLPDQPSTSASSGGFFQSWFGDKRSAQDARATAEAERVAREKIDAERRAAEEKMKEETRAKRIAASEARERALEEAARAEAERRSSEAAAKAEAKAKHQAQLEAAKATEAELASEKAAKRMREAEQKKEADASAIAEARAAAQAAKENAAAARKAAVLARAEEDRERKLAAAAAKQEAAAKAKADAEARAAAEIEARATAAAERQAIFVARNEAERQSNEEAAANVKAQREAAAAERKALADAKAAAEADARAAATAQKAEQRAKIQANKEAEASAKAEARAAALAQKQYDTDMNLNATQEAKAQAARDARQAKDEADIARRAAAEARAQEDRERKLAAVATKQEAAAKAKAEAEARSVVESEARLEAAEKRKREVDAKNEADLERRCQQAETVKSARDKAEAERQAAAAAKLQIDAQRRAAGEAQKAEAAATLKANREAALAAKAEQRAAALAKRQAEVEANKESEESAKIAAAEEARKAKEEAREAKLRMMEAKAKEDKERRTAILAQKAEAASKRQAEEEARAASGAEARAKQAAERQQQVDARNKAELESKRQAAQAVKEARASADIARKAAMEAKAKSDLEKRAEAHAAKEEAAARRKAEQEARSAADAEARSAALAVRQAEMDSRKEADAAARAEAAAKAQLAKEEAAEKRLAAEAAKAAQAEAQRTKVAAGKRAAEERRLEAISRKNYEQTQHRAADAEARESALSRPTAIGSARSVTTTSTLADIGTGRSSKLSMDSPREQQDAPVASPRKSSPPQREVRPGQSGSPSPIKQKPAKPGSPSTVSVMLPKVPPIAIPKPPKPSDFRKLQNNSKLLREQFVTNAPVANPVDDNDDEAHPFQMRGRDAPGRSQFVFFYGVQNFFEQVAFSVTDAVKRTFDDDYAAVQDKHLAIMRRWSPDGRKMMNALNSWKAWREDKLSWNETMDGLMNDVPVLRKPRERFAGTSATTTARSVISTGRTATGRQSTRSGRSQAGQHSSARKPARPGSKSPARSKKTSCTAGPAGGTSSPGQGANDLGRPPAPAAPAPPPGEEPSIHHLSKVPAGGFGSALASAFPEAAVASAPAPEAAPQEKRREEIYSAQAISNPVRSRLLSNLKAHQARTGEGEVRKWLRVWYFTSKKLKVNRGKIAKAITRMQRPMLKGDQALLREGFDAFQSRAPYWISSEGTKVQYDEDGFWAKRLDNEKRWAPIMGNAVIKHGVFRFAIRVSGVPVGMVVGVCDASDPSATTSFDVLAWGLHLTHGSLYTKGKKSTKGVLSHKHLMNVSMDPDEEQAGNKVSALDADLEQIDEQDTNDDQHLVVEIEVDMNRKKLLFGRRGTELVEAPVTLTSAVKPWAYLWNAGDAVMIDKRNQNRRHLTTKDFPVMHRTTSPRSPRSAQKPALVPLRSIKNGPLDPGYLSGPSAQQTERSEQANGYMKDMVETGSYLPAWMRDPQSSIPGTPHTGRLSDLTPGRSTGRSTGRRNITPGRTNSGRRDGAKQSEHELASRARSNSPRSSRQRQGGITHMWDMVKYVSGVYSDTHHQV